MTRSWLTQITWTLIGVVVWVAIGWGLRAAWYVPTVIQVPSATLTVPRSWSVARATAPAGVDLVRITPHGHPDTWVQIAVAVGGGLSEAKMLDSLIASFPKANQAKPQTLRYDGHTMIRAVMKDVNQTEAVEYVRPMSGKKLQYIISGRTPVSQDLRWRHEIEAMLASAQPK